MRVKLHENAYNYLIGKFYVHVRDQSLFIGGGGGGEATIFRRGLAKKEWPSPTKGLKSSGPPFTEVKNIVTLPKD